MFDDLRHPIEQFTKYRNKAMELEGFIRSRIDSILPKAMPKRDEFIMYLISLIENQKTEEMIAHEKAMMINDQKIKDQLTKEQENL